jgi:hypothetical protein
MNDKRRTILGPASLVINHQSSFGPYSNWHSCTHGSLAGRYHHNDTVEASDAHLTNDGNLFRSSMGRLDLFSTRLHKFYEMIFTLSCDEN